ncbi:MAG TPA: Asp23/Gls24 family envelope stress response protein [Candidatus Limnocylindrales bacterium]|nr:Asp23/Gls24 family envelope stress response protein [Candidatus Limnocylindrales bacterium]
MSGSGLTVGRRVVAEMVRLAAFEVPGVQAVGRAGPLWRRLFLAPAVNVRLRDGRVRVRVAVVARPGQPLGPLATQVRTAVAATVERLLGLQLEGVSVIVDGVGG